MLLNFILIGALTIKPYSFKARSWELNYVNSIDFFDSVGSDLKLEMRGKKILRVLPCKNDNLNENWITDKARFSLDSLNNQRLSNFYVKKLGKDLDFQLKDLISTIYLINLEYIFGLFLKKYAKWSVNFLGVIDNYSTGDNLIFSKDWLNLWGTSNIIPSLNINKSFDITFRSDFIFKNSLLNLNSVDLIILLNLNLRMENPIINLKIRNLVLKKKVQVVSFGRINNPNYLSKNLGTTTESFISFVEGKHKFLKKYFTFAHPLMLVGNFIFYRKDSKMFTFLLIQLQKLKSFNYNVVYNQINMLSVMEYGIVPGVNGLTHHYPNKLKKFGYNLILNINNINLSLKKTEFLSIKDYVNWTFSNINIYYGSFGGKNLKYYNYLMPLNVLLETNGTFINIEGKLRFFPTVLSPYKNSKTFFSFYKISLKLLKTVNFFANKIKPSTIFFEKRFNRLNKIYYNHNQLLTVSLYKKNSNSFNSLYKYGYIYKTLLSTYQGSYYINDLYTSYSYLMLKMNKESEFLFNKNYN